MMGLEISKEHRLFIPVEPTPASRPRVSQYGTYYTKTYTAWLNAARSALEGAVPHALNGALSLEVEVLCTKPRTGKLAFPKGDIDNYVKGPMDVLTKVGAWGDDKQVVRLVASKRYTESDELPGTLVRIFELKEQQ